MTETDPDLPADDDVTRLLAIMARLRSPERGCSWDLEQTFETIAPYTIDEAYEVADAIARGDLLDLREELGDLLLQVVFHAQIAKERGAFAFADVVRAINAKLIRRHPHVFGDARDLPAEAVKALWEKVKAEEKAERALMRPALPDQSVLAPVSRAGPALKRARDLQVAAGRVGFDWNDLRPILEKIVEEAGEIVSASREGADLHVISGEVGDLLFAVVNLARHLGVDPETALETTNRKFERRFQCVERGLRQQGKAPGDASLDEMEALWVLAKAEETGR